MHLRSTCNAYENSSANWTFVIAAMLLNQIDSNGTGYKSQGDSVYTWAVANLYQAGTGQIYDSKAHNVGDYTQNYGYAIGAMNEEGAVAHFFFAGIHNYDGQAAGYNVLPDYGQGNLNDSGFNGIAMRWLGIAIGHGTISATPSQANIDVAWANRDAATTLVWNDWTDPPPSGTTFYSWDCSAALAGLLDIPPTA